MNSKEGQQGGFRRGTLTTSSSGLNLNRMPYKFLDNSYYSNSGGHQRRDSKCLVHNLLSFNIPQPKPKEEESDPGSVAPSLLSDTSSTPVTRQSSNDALNLMSKDAISEMVLSVRDLSKNLSSVSMKLEFHNILIISKITDSSLVSVTRDLALWLLTIPAPNGALTVHIQDILRSNQSFEYDRLIEQHPEVKDRIKFWASNGCQNNPNKYDLVIALGGDGTVLYTSWLFQRIVPPVLCFSMGSLGFMTEFDYSRRKQIISSILENGVTCSLRMRFECTIMRARHRDGKEGHSLEDEIENVNETGVYKNHKAEKTICILNDVVVDRGPNPTMTSTVLFADNHYLTAIEADGVVIATPSGSTAYSLSAGGSLVHPDIPGMLISPICPHTLSFRPIVLPDSMVISVGVPYDARETAWCSFDGKSRFELYRGDFLSVTAARYPFPIIQNGNTSSSWFPRLSKTLHWNERKRQKPLG
ncbi:hypothetical protein TRICI_006897 [Trichomonascus ciferrii]|uniref:NAD+ kinase n=1 Tax=Trichomonascus ciferrii TaxID=44093 RepID=A0A642UBV8_9ASCO|nr:hypothetical protein TRICI_006897 [Trichomonascus ciferrii]